VKQQENLKLSKNTKGHSRTVMTGKLLHGKFC